ncbi:MAG: nitroreductase family protein [Desulfuromonadaceae bacterium]
MIDLVRRRRSIRTFTSQPVDLGMVDLLVETLLRSPTSRNNTPWQFVVVDDGTLLNKLSTAKESGSAFLKGAPLAIVVCADSSRSDVWVEDCSIASILLQMTAQSLGLGSCWIQIRKRPHNAETTAEAYIQELLGLPECINVEAIIAIGHPAEIRTPLQAGELQRDKVKHNLYSVAFK